MSFAHTHEICAGCRETTAVMRAATAREAAALTRVAGLTEENAKLRKEWNEAHAANELLTREHAELGALRERLRDARGALEYISRASVDAIGVERCGICNSAIRYCDHGPCAGFIARRVLARLDASPQAAPLLKHPRCNAPGMGPFCSLFQSYNHECRERCLWRAATPVQGAPPFEELVKRAGPLPTTGMATAQAAPADGPTCAAWCGSVYACAPGGAKDAGRMCYGRTNSEYCYCTEACRDARRPLRPAPAVPEPVRELNLGLAPSHAASPLPEEEKKT